MSLTFSVACASTLSSAASAHLRKFIASEGKRERATGRVREESGKWGEEKLDDHHRKETGRIQ